MCLAIAINASVFAGLRNYGYPTLGLGGLFATPWLAPTLAAPLLIVMTIVVFIRSTDRTHCYLMAVVGIALTIGLPLAVWPLTASREGFFEGGISNGSPATLSDYATSVGLSVLLVLGLLVTIDDRERPPRRSPGVIEANGRNPLLCYFLAHSTVGALLTFTALAPINHAIATKAWLDTGVGIAKTIAIALFVWWMTRRKIFWRV